MAGETAEGGGAVAAARRGGRRGGGGLYADCPVGDRVGGGGGTSAQPATERGGVARLASGKEGGRWETLNVPSADRGGKVGAWE